MGKAEGKRVNGWQRQGYAACHYERMRQSWLENKLYKGQRHFWHHGHQHW